jgi:hypothetical protein
VLEVERKSRFERLGHRHREPLKSVVTEVLSKSEQLFDVFRSVTSRLGVLPQMQEAFVGLTLDEALGMGALDGLDKLADERCTCPGRSPCSKEENRPRHFSPSSGQSPSARGTFPDQELIARRLHGFLPEVLRDQGNEFSGCVRS